jgi:hypothetical protein
MSVTGLYEAVLVFSTKNGEESVAALTERFKTLVSQNAAVSAVDEWGKRRLAYPINDEAEGFYEKNLHIIRLTHYCVSPSGNFKVFTLAEMNEIFATLNSEIGFRMAHESDHAAKFNTLNYAALSPEEIIKMEIHFELSGRIAEFLAHRDVLLQSKCLPTAFPKHCMFYTRNYMQKNMSDLLALPEFWLRDSGKSAKLQQSLLKHFGHYFAYLGWLFANKNIPQNPEPDEINAIVSSVLTRFDADFKLYLHSLINGLLENMLNGVIARSQVQTSAVPAKSKEELIKYFWTFDGVCFWDIMDAKTKKQAQESLKKYLAKPALQKHIASVANEYPQYVFHDRDGR